MKLYGVPLYTFFSSIGACLIGFSYATGKMLTLTSVIVSALTALVFSVSFLMMSMGIIILFKRDVKNHGLTEAMNRLPSPFFSLIVEEEPKEEEESSEVI